MNPPAVTVVNEGGRSPVLLICEHASAFIPESDARLGLTPADLRRHIAWDIGAADLARRLSVLLDAPLFLAGYSRLLIDCNRPPGVSSSIPVTSEITDIPGNHNLSAEEVARRTAAYFTPFQASIAAFLDARTAPCIIIGVHSFTPVFRGERRIWHAGVLYGSAVTLAARLLAGLRADPALILGENEPYRIDPAEDYTVPVHGDARGIPAVLIEVRQDLLADAAGIEAWAARLAPVLAEAAPGS